MAALESCESLCGAGRAIFRKRAKTQRTPTQNRHKTHIHILCLCSYVFIKIPCPPKVTFLKSFHSQLSQVKLRNLRFFALIEKFAGNCVKCAFVRYLRGEPGENWGEGPRTGGEPGGGPENRARTGGGSGRTGGEPGASSTCSTEEPGENRGL